MPFSLLVEKELERSRAFSDAIAKKWACFFFIVRIPVPFGRETKVKFPWLGTHTQLL